MAIPVSLPDARRQLRVDADDESMDASIAGYIRDAADWVENYTGHRLTAGDVTQHFDGIGLAPLKAWPIMPGALPSVVYTLDDGSAAVGPELRLSSSTRPAHVVLWKYRYRACHSRLRMAVTVRAGYETAEDVPGNMRRAMLILISAYEADAEGGEIFQKAEATARTLCRPFRLNRL